MGSELTRIKRDLMVANRILAHEDVVDTYGAHQVPAIRIGPTISCSPAHAVRSWSRSTTMMEFDLDGNAVGGDERERYRNVSSMVRSMLRGRM